MLPSLEMRQLHALVLLAEEMNFTRAANRLNVSQPALSKLVTELEEQYGLYLFNREKGRLIEVTDAGQIFIEEARAALSHAERAVQLARAAQEGYERILMVGHSPHCDQSWISTVVGIRLPLYPRLRIRLMGQFPAELVRSVVTGELNLAIVTAPSVNGDVTAVAFAQTPLFAALPENHPAADRDRLELQDLAEDEWILFPKRLHPVFYDTIMEVARRDGITPRCPHVAVTAEQAVQLVSEQIGIGIISKPHPFAFRTKGVVLKPFSEKSLWFQTCVIMRKGDDSRLTNQFVRSFLRKFRLSPQTESQMELPLAA